jgi:hypothetical protein
VFFLGILLPGWYFYGRLSAMLADPIGTAPYAGDRQMKSCRMVISLAAVIGVWGCEPTPYQRADSASANGYSEKMLSEDTFHVQFMGSPATSADVMQEYLYRRAAELTLRHQFRYFAVIREPSPLTEYKTIYLHRVDQSAGMKAEEMEQPMRGTLHMTVQCFKNPQSVSDPSAINAEAYLYGRPELKFPPK